MRTHAISPSTGCLQNRRTWTGRCPLLGGSGHFTHEDYGTTIFGADARSVAYYPTYCYLINEGMFGAVRQKRLDR